MPQTHKLVRDAVEAAMRDDAGGINAQLAAALPVYGISEQIALEWSESGVLYASIASSDFRLSTLTGRLTLAIAPDGSQWTGESRGIKWSGAVGLRLIFHVRYSFHDGDDTLPEDGAVYAVAEAIEDATIEVFQNYRGWSDGVIYARPPDCPEGYPLEYTEDGYEITVPMRVLFKVDAV